MVETIFLTGGNGAFGTAFQEVCDAQHIKVVAPKSGEFDISKPVSHARRFSGERIDAVVHAAAMTNWEQCHDKPREAFRVNTLGTLYMAKIARELDVPLVYISTDGVFDGLQRGYPIYESEMPGRILPGHTYGRTKLWGERFARVICPHNLTVRLGWLFGPNPIKDTKFVGAILRQIARGAETIRAVDDKWGSPTFSPDAASKLLELVQDGATGTRHLVNGGEGVSRCDVAREVCSAWAPRVSVESVPSSTFPSRVYRPENSVLGTLFDDSRMRPWRKALGAYRDRFPDINQFNPS